MKNAVHVGISGFPFGSAAVYNCMSRYRGFAKLGYAVKIINHKAVHGRNIPIKLEKDAEFQGLEYLYTTKSPYKASSFIGRRWARFIGRVNEFFYLIGRGMKGNIDLMIYYPDGSFLELVYYSILARLSRYPIIMHLVEYRSEFESRRGFFKHQNDRLFDQYFPLFVDGVLPISDYLIEKMSTLKYQKPYVKVPPLTDFETFDIPKDGNVKNYFLYAASASYESALKKVISAFELTGKNDFSLYLIISGKEHQLKAVQEIIDKSPKAEQIALFSKIKYSDLVNKYVNAKAFLIPLSNKIQDIARFPYKISEYTASGNPIISTNYGEVKSYFTDGVNALIANQYESDQLADKMKMVISDPEKAILIGQKSRETGYKYFNYDSYTDQLKELLEEIGEIGKI